MITVALSLSLSLSLRSFSELFFLLGSDQDQRAAAEPGSAVSLQTPLDEQQDKLETMRKHLSRAEQAERIGTRTQFSFFSICINRMNEIGSF